jgi:putative component of membrane protein insertase Oxa1/YidC/SpoIIIJ protein YidD
MHRSSSRMFSASAELMVSSIALRRIIRCHHVCESHGYDRN